MNDPIIESSDNLIFAPYNLSYPHLLEQFKDAELDPQDNRWDLIFDFTEKNAEGEKESHFHTLKPEEFNIVTQAIEGFEDVDPSSIPVPQSYASNL